MPATPNNVKMQTLQKDIAGLIFAGQTPRAGQSNAVAGMHTPRDGFTPRSHTPRGGLSRRPRKYSNVSQQNENAGQREDSSIARHQLENAKKPQSCFENSQQQPSAQYNNNIMFIRYGPLIGRKRDRSHQHAADVKMYEQAQDGEKEAKADATEQAGPNAEQEQSKKKSVHKDEDSKQVKDPSGSKQKMVMHPQFIKNLGEHLAQEFFNMNQEYCANSQIEISESDRSEKQHS